MPRFITYIIILSHVDVKRNTLAKYEILSQILYGFSILMKWTDIIARYYKEEKKVMLIL